MSFCILKGICTQYPECSFDPNIFRSSLVIISYGVEKQCKKQLFLFFFQALHKIILDNNFMVVKCKDLAWRRRDSERFYAEHSGVWRRFTCFQKYLKEETKGRSRD